jgi:hypothetical protein
MDAIHVRQSQILPNDYKVLFWRTSWKKYSILSGAYALLVWIVLWATGASPILQILVSVAAFSFVMIGLRYYSISRMVSNPRNRHLHTEKDMTFESDGFRWTTSDGIASSVPWSSVVKVQELPGFTLLWLSTNQYFPVPLDSIPHDRLQDFRSLVKSSVTAPAK